jgi:hypothetical protein
LWIVRSWEHEGCYQNPIALLDETLAERGRDAYSFLLAEIFRVLKKRLGVKANDHIHIVVQPGFCFWPCAAIRPDEDSIQLEGNAVVHPTKEGD